ncbi:nucleotidyltransferase family protein [Vibrio parahaemolyticus]|uniref:hypothetical protein n=1 Tax=Vibrio parahaemolyticus TaxID=670 RepID=UPI001E34E6CE|nr:hypothetical protein [Vibrio parahaemolyticus]
MIDFERRLRSLKDRRQGLREQAIYESMDSISANQAILKGSDIREKESYERLNEKAGVKYAVGAMAAVEEKYTQKSIAEGERVADSLIKSLTNRGEDVGKRIQGSVALDIHIKGHSDVDMLILVNNPVNVEYPKVNESFYTPATDHRSLIEIARDVRTKSEDILPVNFPAADVDCSNNKSIAMEGGSLQRKVDIVPAIWFDSIPYQRSKEEHDRGVKIYHKGEHEFILNYPFKHIKLINDKDNAYSGNLKCVIRLMKNIVADMPEYKHRVAKRLSSFDLAALAYHMNHNDLSVPTYARLGLVETLRMHLLIINSSEAYRNMLSVPDETRKIFDSDEKVEALQILTKEVEDLAQAIFKELRPFATHYDSSEFQQKQVWL